MKNVIRFLVVIVFCLLLYSCRIEDLEHLESYRPKDGFIFNKVINEQQDTVFVYSSWNSNHPKLYEPDWKENDTYPVYIIRCSKHVKPFSVKLESVSATECGESLPFTVFYETCGPDGYSDQAEMVDSIPFTYNISRYYAGWLYVKIKKRQIEIREMTIRYRLNIDGKIIEEEHQYRRAHEIRTKHHILYHRWLRTCNE